MKQKISYEDLLNTLKKMGFPREAFTTKIEEMTFRIVALDTLIGNCFITVFEPTGS